jgi:F-type H+-transporting ATPase subunit c
MPDLSTITLASTVAAIFGIALGVLLPAFAMGRAIRPSCARCLSVWP